MEAEMAQAIIDSGEKINSFFGITTTSGSIYLYFFALVSLGLIIKYLRAK